VGHVPEIEMPEGQYLSLSGLIVAGAGGQTRALLMRNRLLAQKAGIEPILLTFDPTPHYPQVRAALREQGQLVDPMRLVNIFEWYRDTDIDHLEPTGDPLLPLEGFDVEDTGHPDGTVYTTRHVHPRTRAEVAVDYRRPDGSVYLRLPAGKAQATSVILVNSKGLPVRSWSNQKGWRQNWIVSLAPEGRRAFIISDSRFSLAYILPMPDDRFHVMHLMHNIHAKDAWNSAIQPTYVALLKSIHNLDGLVTLTSRQRDDLAARFGATTNLFVVPNPVESRQRPDPLPEREPKRFAIVSRLERQKRLEDAIRAFALVVKEEPDAKLDIYGDGNLRLPLEAEITAAGVQDSVHLRGPDAHARDSLWTATGFLLSSRFEGYPLATLESMSHGCPVIAYDIRYGPREQITDGVNGFLVKPGDIRGMADRILELIRNPGLAERMSQAALDTAKKHDHVAFLNDWRDVVNGVIEKKEHRTTLEFVKLKVTRLGYVRRLRLPSRLARLRLPARLVRDGSNSAAFRTAPRIAFAGRLEVKGHSKRATLDDAVITLDAVCDASGSIVPIPVQARRSGDVFNVSATFDLAEAFNAIESKAHALRLRLRVVWNNSSWETPLRRPQGWAPKYEVSFADDGELTLLRHPRTVRHALDVARSSMSGSRRLAYSNAGSFWSQVKRGWRRIRAARVEPPVGRRRGR
jgi:glycosyltransferase involved in cell wall biosynthesis